MATKVLDLLLQLTVKGGDEAAKLQQAITGLTTAAKGADSLKGLDALLGGPQAIDNLAAAIEKIKKQFQEFQNGLRSSPPRLDLDVSKPNKDLDLLVRNTRTAVDLVSQLGRTKVDFNLDKITAEAEKARAALSRLNAQNEVFRTRVRDIVNGTSQGVQGLNQFSQAADRSTQSVLSFGREILLIRRLLFGLGITAAVNEILGLSVAFDRAKQSLTAAFGSEQSGKEFEFIRGEADRLGLSITSLANDYAKFAISGRVAGLSQQVIRDNFLAVAEAGAKLSLSSEEVSGALTALQQIASKGRLSMEELRQQLGDRLPGAVSIAAKALGITEQRLFAMVEQGQIASNFFLERFPAALRASFGTDAATRIETTQAAIERFKNGLKELLDTAVRAGLLSTFTDALKGMTEAFKDPETVKTVKAFAEALSSLARAAASNASGIKLVLEALLAYKVIGAVGTLLDKTSASFTRLAASSVGVAPALNGAAGAAANLATGAAQASGPVTTLFSRLAVGANALAGVSVVLATATAAIVLTTNAVVEALNKRLDKEVKLAAAINDANLNNRVAAVLEGQIAAQSRYAETLVLTREEIAKLSPVQRDAYAVSAAGALKLAELQKQQAEAQIAAARAEIASGKLTNEQTDEHIRQIVRLKGVSEDAGVTANRFANAIAVVAEEANKGKFVFAALNDETKNLVLSFEKSLEAGEGLKKALTNLLPKDLFSDTTINGVAKVANALDVLQQRGQNAVPIITQLAQHLHSLSGDDLTAFQVKAQAAFESAKISAQGLAIIIDSVLRAALNKLGLDAEDAGKRVSKSFGETLTAIQLVATSAKATGDQIKGAIEQGVSTAKTREELIALQSVLKATGVQGGQFAADVADAFLKLDDAIRLRGGELATAVGDSFKRLGVSSKAQLAALADQAQVDFRRIEQSGLASADSLRAAFIKAFQLSDIGLAFERVGVQSQAVLKTMADQAESDFTRIKASGLASTETLKEAFRKFAEEATKANNGIPPIKIVVQLAKFDAFDLLVKAAETAADRTRKAILNAIPTAETVAEIKILRDGIIEAFDAGKLSAQQFAELVTQATFRLRELAAVPTGELKAAADLLGVQTKDQLTAISDNFRDAFNAISTSGQFTSAQLAEAAKKYVEAYKAANDGVIDSFDPVLAKAQEVIDKVNETSSALDNMKNKAKFSLETDGGNLHDLSLQQLQQMLADLSKSFREIGISNVGSLQIIQQIQEELRRRSEEDTKNRLAQSDAAAAQQQNQTRAPTPGGGGAPVGGVTNNFNFNGSVANADEIRRSVIPILEQTQLRRR
jgi:tape measure domain-containing protein